MAAGLLDFRALKAGTICYKPMNRLTGRLLLPAAHDDPPKTEEGEAYC
jgi:hypothetical protein